jgi:hypothetical protein
MPYVTGIRPTVLNEPREEALGLEVLVVLLQVLLGRSHHLEGGDLRAMSMYINTDNTDSGGWALALYPRFSKRERISPTSLCCSESDNPVRTRQLTHAGHRRACRDQL